MTAHKTPCHIAIIGSQGTLANAIAQAFLQKPNTRIHMFGRGPERQARAGRLRHYPLDILKEEDLKNKTTALPNAIYFQHIVITTGILHTIDVQPEKCLKHLTRDTLATYFSINTIAPALVAKYFVPRLSKHRPATFTALSARVGSIQDNHLGGWYGYRMSKAALNMFLKTLSIELKRTHPNVCVAGLHPGTVDSPLSKPFQKNVPQHKLFSPDFSAGKLTHIIDHLSPDDTGKIIAWDGQTIEY